MHENTAVTLPQVAYFAEQDAPNLVGGGRNIGHYNSDLYF
jgi:hypothetical protein